MTIGRLHQSLQKLPNIYHSKLSGIKSLKGVLDQSFEALENSTLKGKTQQLEKEERLKK